MSNINNNVTITVMLQPQNNARLAMLCGQLNANLLQIERQLTVSVTALSNSFAISGNASNVDKAKRVLTQLYAETENATPISSEVVFMAMSNYSSNTDSVLNSVPKTNLPINSYMNDTIENVGAANSAIAEIEVTPEKPKLKLPYDETQDVKTLVLNTPKMKIIGKNPSQRNYIRQMLTHDISFGIGPAGTGKTYLAVACAVSALNQHEIARIILVRPAVEAGERLGFLPGDIGQKVDPYLRPLYDAMYDMLGFEKVAKLIEQNVIEIAPLAYMRGRTLNDAAVILDEAQNTTIEQMKMFLTRVGFGSKAMITGDLTQIDLPKNVKSGLRHASEVLSNIDDIGFSYFNPDDVVRHPLVQKIVKAYEAFEAKEKNPN